eukprot:5101933-Alexandrium_andersonii.AAC.1
MAGGAIAPGFRLHGDLRRAERPLTTRGGIQYLSAVQALTLTPVFFQYEPQGPRWTWCVPSCPCGPANEQTGPATGRAQRP